MTPTRARVAALLRETDILKGNPTGGTLHVPAPLGVESDDDKKKRRARAAAALGYTTKNDDDTLTLARRIAKGEDSAQYIGRQVINADQLRVWWELEAMTGAARTLDPNPHITVAYSKKEFTWSIDRSWVVIHPEQFDGIGLLGPDNAVVLFLKSPLLESRWQGTRDAGATWSYNGYRPHVTMCYLGADYDPQLGGYSADQMVQPPFPIILGPELMATGGVDVFEAVKAPEWYQVANGVTKHDEGRIHVTVNVAQPAITVPVEVNNVIEQRKNDRAKITRDPLTGGGVVEFTDSTEGK